MIDGPKWQFARYLLVGMWNTLFGLAAFMALNHLFTPVISNAYFRAPVCSVLGYAISITNNYIGYKFFVFKTQGNFLREYLRFYVVYVSALLINLALMNPLIALFNHILAIHPTTLFAATRLQFTLDQSQSVNISAVMLTGVTVVISYFGHQKFSFKKKEAS